MTRFIRSALFPIIIVIIVAMFIEFVIQGNSKETKNAYTYQGTENSFVSDLESNKVQSVVINTKDQTLQVTPKSGDKRSR